MLPRDIYEYIYISEDTTRPKWGIDKKSRWALSKIKISIQDEKVTTACRIRMVKLRWPASKNCPKNAICRRVTASSSTYHIKMSEVLTNTVKLPQ
jgi:hypothetical protein